uniref:Type VI secretion system protein VasD n=1 Tax=Candidatus Kentrum sp. SD TaxID=2126332 RepID=A0A451BLA3_9GAMM|nr:MAG: type VI secretion system protein VasD [Candidatus Kentron sp. SD]VFK40180.1 MAG: type VI secretion system protein VasD [Candidatus Kentron sp. SD]VFK79079.1 MAG: type VI secretion system protein VasD [Candidatus Kentron sp. SD]
MSNRLVALCAEMGRGGIREPTFFPSISLFSRYLRKVALLSFFVFPALVLSGCCATVEKSTQQTRTLLQADIRVSENSNPDPSGRPTPVTLRVYQLKSSRNFESADFPALYGNDEAVLGADLLFKEEMDVYPGIEIPFERKLEEATRYLGIMVAFRNAKNATWRALTDLPAGGAFPLLIKIDGFSVSIRKP